MDYRDFFESRNLRHYLEEIARFPALTEDEERKLGEKVRQGDEEALQTLVKSNLKFVVSYAVWWIRQAILHALTLNSRAYSIPQKLADQVSQMNKKHAELKSELGREPTRDEIARAMGVTEADVEDLEILGERYLSLSKRIDGKDVEVEDRMSDAASPSFEEDIIKAWIQQEIRGVLGELDEKEALVLKLRFGLDDDRPRTLREIGSRLNLTRERIRQIEQKAMRKLGRLNKLQHLRGYLN